MTASHEHHPHHTHVDKEAARLKRRSRYGLIAFVVLLGVFCEIYSQKFAQNPQFQSQFKDPRIVATSTFQQPIAGPTAADAIPTSPVPGK